MQVASDLIFFCFMASISMGYLMPKLHLRKNISDAIYLKGESWIMRFMPFLSEFG